MPLGPHLADARLAAGVVHTDRERAHIATCAACRARGRLAKAAVPNGPTDPVLDRVRAGLQAQLAHALEAASVEAGAAEGLGTGDAGPSWLAGTADGPRVLRSVSPALAERLRARLPRLATLDRGRLAPPTEVRP